MPREFLVGNYAMERNPVDTKLVNEGCKIVSMSALANNI
jgi:hypothetical protein